MTSIKILRAVENTKNGYLVEVDGVEMTVYTRDGQDPKEVIEDLLTPKEPTYIEKRLQDYPSIQEQLDMMYHDFENWHKCISEIKAKYPK